VVKHVDAVELRVVVAAVLAVAAVAVLVAQHLLKLCAHLVTALARLHVHNLTRKSSLEIARARASRTGMLSDFTTLTSRASILWKARWVWAGAVIFASATCSLQFAKASAATLSQQEKNDTADVQRGREYISGFVDTVAC
jgi:hypothetical protein